MAKPIDLDESFVDIRSGISIDPILVEEARSIKNSLEPEAKICDNEIIGQIRLRDKVNDIWTNIEDPCVFLPIQHTDSTEGLLPTKDPNEFLRDTELCVASKTVESCALHTIYKKGKLENPSCAPNMLLDCGPTFGPFERKRMHFQDRACIFSELYQCLRYQSFAERQESRNERSISVESDAEIKPDFHPDSLLVYNKIIKVLGSIGNSSLPEIVHFLFFEIGGFVFS